MRSNTRGHTGFSQQTLVGVSNVEGQAEDDEAEQEDKEVEGEEKSNQEVEKTSVN